MLSIYRNTVCKHKIKGGLYSTIGSNFRFADLIVIVVKTNISLAHIQATTMYTILGHTLISAGKYEICINNGTTHIHSQHSLWT